MIGEILAGLRGFVDLEGGNSEYGSGQAEVNLAPRAADPPAPADQAARLKYATREIARRAGPRSPPSWRSHSRRSRATRCTCTSRCGATASPAFAPEGGVENALHPARGRGSCAICPGSCLHAPTVNSYKRFPLGTFAPTSVTWGGDNWTVAVRRSVEAPARHGIDCEPAQPTRSRTGRWPPARRDRRRLEAGLEPAPPREGNPTAPAKRCRPARRGRYGGARRHTVAEILGEDAVHDYGALAELSGGPSRRGQRLGPQSLSETGLITAAELDRWASESSSTRST